MGLIWIFLCAVPGAAVERLDPIGVWSCLLFGHPALGDERVLFRIDPTGAAAIARLDAETVRAWAPMSHWEQRRNVLFFEDSRTGRRFEADLRRTTLGGRWESQSLSGGWWCTEYAGSVADIPSIDESGESPLMPPLIPHRMATPNYPRPAIREAREGRVVVCFLVNSNGAVREPEVVEISDEIFRLPTLNALSRSQYRGWEDDSLVRPGCRSFVYRLDSAF